MKVRRERAIAVILVSIFLLPYVLVPTSADAAITEIVDEDGNPVEAGVYDDTLYVLGEGVTAGVEVNLYWDAVKSWDGEKGLLTSEEAEADGSFEIEFNVPEAVYGDHYLWVKDTDTGSIARSPDPFVVDARLKLTPRSGLPGDDITMRGYGFGEEAEIVYVKFGTEELTTSPRSPETDELGTWVAHFTVPDKDYDDYVITAEDENGNIGTVDFTVGPAITLDVEEGPVGTVVEVEGRGFTEDGTVESIVLDGVDCGVLDEDDLEIDGNGEFTFELVIPQVSEVEEYELWIADNEDLEAAADFEVLGLAEIEVTPNFGTPGSTISICGWNFTARDGEEVEIYIGSGFADTFETNSKGEFSGEFDIPAMDAKTYDLTAEQEDYNIIVSELFRVGFKIVLLSETEGPTGMLVSLTGAGFSENGQWNATFGDEVIFEKEDVNSGGSISEVFHVPLVDPDTYTITVWDIDDETKVTIEFEVTDKTRLTLDPASAPIEYNVSIEGLYFAESDGDIEVEFILYNSTDDWDMDVYMDDGMVYTGDDGNFTAWWLVPEDLNLGSYTINATDEEGLFTQSTFYVVGKEISISPMKSIYHRGDTVSFDIESSFEEECSYIKIWDPDGNLYWKTDDLDTWVSVGAVQVAPYFTQTAGGNPMILTSDASLGEWTWTWYDSENDVLESGILSVQALTPEDILTEKVDKLAKAVSDLQDQLEGLSEDISTGAGDDFSEIKVAVDDAKEAADNAAEAVSSIENLAQDSKSSADSAKKASEDAKVAVEEVKIMAKSLTNLVYGAIGASMIAALVAVVCLIQISRGRS